MLKNTFLLQKLKPTKGDWAETITKDKEKYEICHEDTQIAQFSRDQFKHIVEVSVNKEAIKFLNTRANSHSKVAHLVKTKIEAEEYVTSDKLSQKEIQLLFALRTRMTNVKANFKTHYGENIFCNACKIHPETQQHLLQCKDLNQDITIPIGVEYDDIFGPLEKQRAIIKVYTQIFRNKEMLENNLEC